MVVTTDADRTGPDRAISIVLVDDHPMVRAGVRGFLSAQPNLEVCGEAGSARDGVREILRLVPDVVLVDLMLDDSAADADGIAVIEQVARECPAVRIAVLTSYVDEEYVFPALRAGAQSYLLKDSGPEQLVDAVRRTAAGEAVLHPRVAAKVVRQLRGEDTGDPNPFRELSERELEVLRVLADGASNREISAALSISETTVKTHVRAILTKLDVVDRTQAAVLAWRTGVVRRGPGGPARPR